MGFKFKKLPRIFYKAGYYTVMHDGIEHAGYLSFLALLSIFPFLVFVFAIASGLGNQDVGAEFISDFQQLLPDDVALTLMPRINEILSGPPPGLLTLAIIGVIWTSSAAVEGTRTILNRAYRVMSPPSYVFRRLMSMLYIIILTFIVVVSMFFLTLAPTLWESTQTALNTEIEYHPKWGILRYYLSAFLIFFAVATSYYILPNIKQKWTAVVPGAAVVLFFWLLFAYLFSSYISYYKQVNVVYGSLAGIILTLLYFYVLSIIYIFGAEFNYFFERALGHKIVQKQ